MYIISILYVTYSIALFQCVVCFFCMYLNVAIVSGLRNKRAMLAGKDNTLSQLLREAKEQAEDAREMVQTN